MSERIEPKNSCLSTDLIRAIREDDVERANQLINEIGVSDWRELVDSYNLLLDAIQDNKIEMSKLLITSGAILIDIENEEPYKTPFYVAVQRGYTEIVGMFLDRNSDFNTLDKWSFSPLYSTRNGTRAVFFAIDSDKFDIAAMLVNHGACVNRIGWSETLVTYCHPLHLAVMKQTKNLVELLLNKGANINAKMGNDKTPLHIATTNMNGEILELLLERGANSGDDALLIAINRNWEDGVMILLKYGVDCNARRKNCDLPLHSAALKNNPRIVKMLIDNGGNLDAHGVDALMAACSNNSIDVVKFLVERNVNFVAEDLGEAFLESIKYNRGMTNTLISLGADVNVQDSNGTTALHIVVYDGYPTRLNILLNHGADVNITCRNFRTPLDCANEELSSSLNFRDDEDTSFNASMEICETLEKHIISIMALDFYVSDNNMNALEELGRHREVAEALLTDGYYYLKLRTFAEVEDMKAKINDEVADMKIRMISDSGISFYELLVANISQLVKYMKNEQILETLESKSFHRDFPTYSSMFTRRIEQGVKRKTLLTASHTSFTHICGFDFPNRVTTHLFEFLSDRVLENLIKADVGDKRSDLTVRSPGLEQHK